MFDIREELIRLGFDHVTILNGKEADIPQKKLILCFQFYSANLELDSCLEVGLIHPYYPVSQRAYRITRNFVQQCRQEGISIEQANHIPIKHILNRLPFLERGKNTLSYYSGNGSRFHVQILTYDHETESTDRLDERTHDYFCGSCNRCMRKCPTGAILENGFEPEKCLRFWMLSGKCPPDNIIRKMGNRLIGCDECERCCPHNPPGTSQPVSIPINKLLAAEDTDFLSELIGKNYARKSRIQIQACIIAASQKRKDLLELICRTSDSTHPEVRKAANAAIRIITEN